MDSGRSGSETASELRALVDRGDIAELHERLDVPLGFGTAGLRGLVGAGPSRMNRAVVTRTTRALAEHLLANVRDARTLPVVVGYDGRLSSRMLAETTVKVLAAARIPVRYFADPVPTPLVAYATLRLAANAGIVITASHNPGEYNGYKVYAKNGVQIIPPDDADVERRSEALGPANTVALADGDWGASSGIVSPVNDDIRQGYLSDIDAARPRTNGDRSLRIVYTPLHGVGGSLMLEAFSRAGFSNVSIVRRASRARRPFSHGALPESGGEGRSRSGNEACRRAEGGPDSRERS